jgi:nucleotide-binding universal stress UspA family protein
MDRILVGLDGSPRAPQVLAQAVDLALRTGAHLFLYRAVGIPAELPALAFSVSPSELAGVLERMAKEELETLARSVPPQVLGGIRVSLAIPWQGVCEAAHLERADLIVVGSHGYGGLDRLLGTTAAKIVNHAEQSVLVVKAKKG